MRSGFVCDLYLLAAIRIDFRHATVYWSYSQHTQDRRPQPPIRGWVCNSHRRCRILSFTFGRKPTLDCRLFKFCLCGAPQTVEKRLESANQEGQSITSRWPHTHVTIFSTYVTKICTGMSVIIVWNPTINHKHWTSELYTPTSDSQVLPVSRFTVDNAFSEFTFSDQWFLDPISKWLGQFRILSTFVIFVFLWPQSAYFIQ